MAMFECIIVTAFNQKLALGVLSTDVLNTIVIHIKDIANKNNYNNFIHQPADLYELETSFIHWLEEQTVVIILLVLFVENENLLLLYEFFLLPIHFKFSANLSVVPEVGQNDLIAIGNTETFQTLSSSDPNSFIIGPKLFHHRTTFFCECQMVFINTHRSRLVGLPLPGQIISLGNNTWLVYSVGMIATNHVCTKARSSSPLTIRSGQAIKVKPGCHILTMDHIITANDSEELEIHSTWPDWTMTLLQLFNYHNGEQINHIILELR